MLLRWITGLIMCCVLMLNVNAAEVKDAPLPFDDPASAPTLAKKKPVKYTKARKRGNVKPSKKTSGKPVVARVVKKPVAKKLPPKKK